MKRMIRAARSIKNVNVDNQIDYSSFADPGQAKQLISKIVNDILDAIPDNNGLKLDISLALVDRSSSIIGPFIGISVSPNGIYQSASLHIDVNDESGQYTIDEVPSRDVEYFVNSIPGLIKKYQRADKTIRSIRNELPDEHIRDLLSFHQNWFKKYKNTSLDPNYVIDLKRQSLERYKRNSPRYYNKEMQELDEIENYVEMHQLDLNELIRLCNIARKHSNMSLSTFE